MSDRLRDADLPISALQHLLFCERQCALIHIEGLWAENRLTIEGRHLHERAHDGPEESRRGVRITRGMPLYSSRLGIHGKADVIEFSRENPGSRERAYPIEYKRGRPKVHDADRVQLCAQALCLEEMLELGPGSVREGALFYGRTRRREVVSLGHALRSTTISTIDRLHSLIDSGITPRVAREKKCDRCSMLNLCLPGGTGPGRSAVRWLTRMLDAAGRGVEQGVDTSAEEYAEDGG